DPDATQNPGSSAISGSTFEYTQFVNPTGSLTVNLGGNGDTITVGPMDAAFAAGTFVINGGAGADTVHVRATSAGVSTQVNTGGGVDTVNVGTAANSLDSLAGVVTVNGG